MIEVVNLERLSGDGYKMCANNPLAENLSNITHARLVNASNSADYIQGAFVTGSNSTVEFDVRGSLLTTPLKLYVSTNGETYGENKSWGGSTGIRLKEYLSYTALLNQTGTNAPTATVLHNDLNVEFLWNYDDAGTYYVAAYGPVLTENKTFSTIVNTATGSLMSVGNYTSTTVYVYTSDWNGSLIDNLLANTSFEIRVYP